MVFVLLAIESADRAAERECDEGAGFHRACEVVRLMTSIESFAASASEAAATASEAPVALVEAAVSVMVACGKVFGQKEWSEYKTSWTVSLCSCSCSMLGNFFEQNMPVSETMYV
jgi:hypothetical protein